ncbi:MAG: helix-turn-helix domain-containing protein [Pseudomonadales bacterium]|nr:helix-turn-helix domain-containing protein [Pseudomonadales bacterium]
MAGISKDIKAEIIAKVKAGQKVADLAKAYGISTKTIYNWLRGQVKEQVSMGNTNGNEETNNLRQILEFSH